MQYGIDLPFIAGNYNAVVRQGVAALLNSAAFGSAYPYPMGATSFTTLKQLLYNSLSTCSCPSTLVKALDSANRHEFDASQSRSRFYCTGSNRGGTFSFAVC
jgi:hypothetical protein